MSDTAQDTEKDGDGLPPITACTVSRNIEDFEALIGEMEVAVGDAWGDLTLSEAGPFLSRSDSNTIKFLAIAIDDSDSIEPVTRLIAQTKGKGIKSLLVTRDLSPQKLHQLLRAGADDFVPYPPPPGEIPAAITRMSAAANAEASAPKIIGDAGLPAVQNRNGAVFAVQGLSGGTGASTFAASLAWELANSEVTKDESVKVCLMDLDLQFGSLASLLDIPQRAAVIELLSDTENMDDSSFLQALQGPHDNLQVLTAPDELVPLDILRPADISRLIESARRMFDYVVIDMPRAVTDWSEIVLVESQIYFAMLETELLSAQNCVRFKTALAAAGLPTEKLRFVLNRAPKFTDMNGRGRVKRMCEGLDIALEVQLPDGGKQVAQAADQGEALAKAHPKNVLRKEVMKLARSIHALGTTPPTAD